MIAEKPGIDRATAMLMGRIAVLEELVRWLSLPYGVNEPVFAGATGEGTLNGLPLGAAPQLHTIWHQVVGRPVAECGGPDPHRNWTTCPVCRQWTPVTTIIDGENQ